MKYLKLFQQHSDYVSYMEGTEAVLPNISYCLNEDKAHIVPRPHNYDNDYLTFEALESGTFTLTIPTSVRASNWESVSYSTDNGVNWTTTAINDNDQTVTTPTINAGDKVLWKGIGNACFGATFSSSNNFIVYGNINSLLFNNNFTKALSLIGRDYAYAELFSQCDKLINARQLRLTAVRLSEGCYMSMFNGCTSLVSIPELPASILNDSCYSGMFENCISVISVPKLPSQNLADQCYYGMFKGCTGIKRVPVDMLPATTLANSCYSNMFMGCTGLKRAPELPALTLSMGCYNYMFNYCTSLNYVKALFTTTTEFHTNDWLANVATNGTFVKNRAAQWNINGVDGVPVGWTVELIDA